MSRWSKNLYLRPPSPNGLVALTHCRIREDAGGVRARVDLRRAPKNEPDWRYYYAYSTTQSGSASPVQVVRAQDRYGRDGMPDWGGWLRAEKGCHGRTGMDRTPPAPYAKNVLIRNIGSKWLNRSGRYVRVYGKFQSFGWDRHHEFASNMKGWGIHASHPAGFATLRWQQSRH